MELTHFVLNKKIPLIVTGKEWGLREE